MMIYRKREHSGSTYIWYVNSASQSSSLSRRLRFASSPQLDVERFLNFCHSRFGYLGNRHRVDILSDCDVGVPENRLAGLPIYTEFILRCRQSSPEAMPPAPRDVFAFQGGNNYPIRKIMQVEWSPHLCDSENESIRWITVAMCFEVLRQNRNNRNRCFGRPCFRFFNYVRWPPRSSLDMQLVAFQIFPTKSLYFRFPQAAECGQRHNCCSRLIQRVNHSDYVIERSGSRRLRDMLRSRNGDIREWLEEHPKMSVYRRSPAWACAASGLTINVVRLTELSFRSRMIRRGGLVCWRSPASENESRENIDHARNAIDPQP